VLYYRSGSPAASPARPGDLPLALSSPAGGSCTSPASPRASARRRRVRRAVSVARAPGSTVSVDVNYRAAVDPSAARVELSALHGWPTWCSPAPTSSRGWTPTATRGLLADGVHTVVVTDGSKGAYSVTAAGVVRSRRSRCGWSTRWARATRLSRLPGGLLDDLTSRPDAPGGRARRSAWARGRLGKVYLRLRAHPGQLRDGTVVR